MSTASSRIKPAANCTFSKQMTLIVKGIAICAMFFHHTVSNSPSQPVEIAPNNIALMFASAGKVCVPLFMILSGYGITKSFESFKAKGYKCSGKFVINHIVKLILSFIFVYALSAVFYIFDGGSLTQLYGGGITGIFYFLKDILGLERFIIETPSVCTAWWFMEAAIVCYALTPLLYRIIAKNKIVGLVFTCICYLPWIIKLLILGWETTTDREIFYIFSFAVGMFCARYGVFDGLVKLSEKAKVTFGIISVIIMTVMFFIRSQLCLLVDDFWALSIIVFAIGVARRVPVVRPMLESLGENSSDMYMFHMSLKPLIASVFISNGCKCLFFIIVCWGVAMLLTKIKEIIHYNSLIKRLQLKY